MLNILVVIDIQNDFVDGVLGTKEAQAVVPKVVEKIQGADWDCIYYTMDTHWDDYLKTEEGKKLPIPHCIYGTDGWEICNQIYRALNNSRNKPCSVVKSGFASQDLINIILEDLQLADFDEKVEVHFCGVCTDICVISNVLALAPWISKARIVVDSACCAGTTPENHEMALKIMKQCQIDIENWSNTNEN